MRVPLRRVGNSLGVIVPKPVLDSWGVGEGDELELTERGLRPAPRAGLSHGALDELKRSIALAVVRQFTPREIRAQILANLHRWRRQGAWVSAYDEWSEIAVRGDEDHREVAAGVDPRSGLQPGDACQPTSIRTRSDAPRVTAIRARWSPGERL